MKHISQFSPFDRPRKDSPWVLLYSDAQQAHHIEPLADYCRKAANGYRVIALTETYEQASRQCEERQRELT